MKNKSLVQQALEQVPGFPQSYQKFCNTLLVDQKSVATINNYSRYFAAISLRYGCVADLLTDTQIETFLAEKLLQGASRSIFRHLVCSLRSYYRCLGMEDKAITMPRIKRTQSLLP